MKKIGLYFGSFNPITNAHMTVATDAADYKVNGEYLFDEVWFVTSPHNPHKYTDNLAPFTYRSLMVCGAIHDSKNTKLVHSEIENYLPTPSYTIDTLDELESKHPDDKFSIICGTDTYLSIKTWKSGSDILEKYDFFVVKRGVLNFVRFKESDVVTELGSTMSATLVRDRISSGKSIDFMVPPSVRDFIHANDIYKK